MYLLNTFRKQRNDKNKKRSNYIKRNLSYETRRTGRNLLKTIKENPVETAALVTGSLLAARYGSKGISNAIKTKTNLGTGIGKTSIIKGKAFVKGAAQGVKKDLNRIDTLKKYFTRNK